jgi:hypothetical protein
MKSIKTSVFLLIIAANFAQANSSIPLVFSGSCTIKQAYHDHPSTVPYSAMADFRIELKEDQFLKGAKMSFGRFFPNYEASAYIQRGGGFPERMEITVNRKKLEGDLSKSGTAKAFMESVLPKKPINLRQEYENAVTDSNGTVQDIRIDCEGSVQ